ncbi:MAG TPA: uroporphyrinogen-III C-methyltransferase [Terriglobia bacterium]|nr:uroporphyrinogen-III C-methyltransferase [Terriglobia bacterium]
MTGKVYLVGAGPGDPELLTLKALRILREADVIFHDDLVSPEILRLVPPEVRVSSVGKRCGRKSVTQAEINSRMIAAAQQGLTVLRLKAGDPGIFGRGGEEIEALVDADVEFEIVPGVTSACAAAASAGISLTHRRSSSSVLFLTGHTSAARTENQWPELNSGGIPDAATLVIYMPGPDYAQLRDRLRAAGVKGDTPCLLVSSASTGSAGTHSATVDKLAELAITPAPNILLVGDVTRAAREAAGAALHQSVPWQQSPLEDRIRPLTV